MRERYVGKYPFQIIVNQHLIQQGYTIISTSGFSNRIKYSRYVDEGKTFGQIRGAGFDVVMFDRDERLIGAEVKAELSWNEFQRAFGEVAVNLTIPYWQSRVEEGMIIMPINRLADDRTSAREELMEQIENALENSLLRDYHVSMKYL